MEKEAESLHQDKREGPDLLDKDDGASEHISDRQPDIVDDHSGKSRSSFQFPNIAVNGLLFSYPILGILLKADVQEPELES